VPSLTQDFHPDERLTLRRLIAGHKRLALGAAAVVALLVALFVVDVVGSSSAAVGDSTTCAEWSSASQAQQQAYGQLYQHEHGSVPGGTSGVLAAVNHGCMQAFANDVEDTANVAQAARP
jgi:hypothetical protein